MGYWWSGTSKGNRKYSGRNPLPMSGMNFTSSGLGSKAVLRGKRPKTNSQNGHTNNKNNENLKPERHASHSVFI
jgi:hypothetical protein